MPATTQLRAPTRLTAGILFRGTINLLQQRHPRIATLFGTLVTFGVLAYGIYYKLQALSEALAVMLRLRSYFESSISIPQHNPMQQLVLSWLAENVKTASSKSMSLQTSIKASRRNVDDASIKDDLDYVPNVDTTSFRFNGRTFYVKKGMLATHDAEGRIVNAAEDMTISYTSFGTNNTAPIKEFLATVHLKATKSKETFFYRVEKEGMSWAPPVEKVTRSMDTIAMRVNVKEDLLADITSFLSEESKTFYASIGKPHRRGYLFYGPPGCGKSSIASALAGRFKLQVYNITLSNPALTDDLLEVLFAQIPEQALILLEDIDSAGVERSPLHAKGKQSKKPSRSRSKGVTLSGLLNVIDGVLSAEHRVLCMTSNTPDSLDSALVRPGRIDKSVLFANADREVMQQLFDKIFASLPADTTTSCTYNIAKLSRAFAASLPEDKLTPAELQNFLLLHRGRPTDAVEKARAWALELIETKAQGRNVSQFTGQIGDVKSDITKPSLPAEKATGLITPPTTPGTSSDQLSSDTVTAHAPADAPDAIKTEHDVPTGLTQPPSVDEPNSSDGSDDDDSNEEYEESIDKLKQENKTLKAKIKRFGSDPYRVSPFGRGLLGGMRAYSGR